MIVVLGRLNLGHAGLALSLIGGCTSAPLDFTNRECPCGPGWVCTPLNICEPEGESTSDSGTQLVDAAIGIDSGMLDGGILDSEVDSDSSSDSGTDAEAPDATLADSSTSSGNTACNDAFLDALQCHSFDEFLPGWTPSDENSSIEISTDEVYRGTSSARASAGDGRSKAFVQEGWGTPLFSGPLYFRGYFYIPETPVPNFDWTLMAFQETVSPYDGISVRIEGDALVIHAPLPGNGARARATQPFPTERWMCIQVAIDINASAGSVQVHVDGELHAEMLNRPTAVASGFGMMFKGIGWGGAGDPIVVYMDETIVDTSPIPCDEVMEE